MTAPWVQTHSGVPFDLLAPRAEAVRIDDVARHLSRLARWSGGTLGDHGYSVAQHSLLVADLLEVWGADARLQREGLLHDAGETYYGDVTSPVQRAMRDLHREMIARAVASVLLKRANHPALDSIIEALGELAEELQQSDPLRELKLRVDPVVRIALGLAAEEHPLVKRADLVALAIERKLVMSPCERPRELPELADTRWSELHADQPTRAERRFLERHRALTDALSEAA